MINHIDLQPKCREESTIGRNFNIKKKNVKNSGHVTKAQRLNNQKNSASLYSARYRMKHRKINLALAIAGKASSAFFARAEITQSMHTVHLNEAVK